MGDYSWSSSQRKGCLVLLNASFLITTTVFLTIQTYPPKFFALDALKPPSSDLDCHAFQHLPDSQAKCLSLKSRNPCVSQGYIDYLHIFYCSFGESPFLGHLLLLLWLLVLFYLLGNTASHYFCSSLEDLSRLLKLSPTIAGVTLLSLGNGAPDVFASFVSFAGSGTRDIGFNTMVGGASFVTCVVVGTISFLVKHRRIRVSRAAFVRDVCFFLLVLGSLIMTIFVGEVNLWGAIGYSLMYVVYVIVVYISHLYWTNGYKECSTTPSSSCESGLSIPLLMNKEIGEEDQLEWRNVGEAELSRWWFNWRRSDPCSLMIYIAEMPLYLPRRLTIPVFSERDWSKPMAITSVILAPILLSTLWIAQYHSPSIQTFILVYGIGWLVGVTLGVVAYLTTEESSPPEKCLLPWVAGGFLMSVTWSYITAQELVALLVSMGYIFGISPSILGLTVLAWGNSLSDLITNSTMALNGGPEGVQVAISGCYAGPIFNILFGLGLSLVGSCWQSYPDPVLISSDPYLLETLGFLVASLVWALVVLPRRRMKLDGVLGGGLLLIYLMSVSLRLIQSSGSLVL
ncbi:Cation/calcium exchanger 2 [Linum perenne]